MKIEDCVVMHRHASTPEYCLGKPHFCLTHGTTFLAPDPCPEGRAAKQSEPRWQQIKNEIERIDERRRLLSTELQEIKQRCPHASLPKRGPVEEYMDTCPDCGHVRYQYAI